MEIRSEQRGQTTVISLDGSLDALTAGEARSAIEEQLGRGQLQLVLDLGQLDFMSSSGLRVLLEMLKEVRGMGGDLRLAAAQPGVHRSLEIAGLVRVLQIYPTLEEAMRSFDVPEP